MEKKDCYNFTDAEMQQVEVKETIDGADNLGRHFRLVVTESELNSTV